MKLEQSSAEQSEIQLGALMQLEQTYPVKTDHPSKGPQLIKDINRYILNSAIGEQDIKPCDLSLTETLPYQLKHQLCLYMLMLCCINSEVNVPMFKHIKLYAKNNKIHDNNIKDIDRILQKHELIFMLDVARRVLFKPKDIKATLKEHGLIKGLLITANNYLNAFKIGFSNAKLAKKYKALGNLEPNTFGHAYYQYMIDHEFVFAGERHSTPEQITLRHDCYHVLSGYSTELEGEVQVVAFTNGTRKLSNIIEISESLRNGIFATIYTTNLGIHVTSQVPEPGVGRFNSTECLKAFKRGQHMNTDLYDPNWNFWDYAHEDLEELRRKFNVLPE